MQNAATVLDVLRERGRRGLPLDELYRQLFNPQLYLLAYGRIYSNKGAMRPGATGETADGMSLGKIGRIIDALRHERYRWSPAKRIYIPKKNGKLRPLGLPPWSDKLVGEVVRLLLEAYYEPSFSGRSHGFRPGRGCAWLVWSRAVPSSARAVVTSPCWSAVTAWRAAVAASSASFTAVSTSGCLTVSGRAGGSIGGVLSAGGRGGAGLGAGGGVPGGGWLARPGVFAGDVAGVPGGFQRGECSCGRR